MFQLANIHRLVAGVAVFLVSGCDPAPASVDLAPTLVPAIKSEATPNSLQDFVSRAHAEHNLIALGAVVASSEGIIDIAVAGLRAKDSADPVQVADKWHLGSNTKALTALLYAKLVERDLAHWGATLVELFPDLAEDMDPAWRDMPIEDLFSHRTGMKQMGGFWLNARRNDDRSISDQRAIAARDVLTQPPSKPTGDFDYNNLNYIVAGAAIEVILRSQPDLPDTWEAAMQVVLFDALEGEALQSGFGFGPPLTGLEGHRTILGTFPRAVGRGKSADNPMVLGPAGTSHATLESHAALALEFLKPDSEIIPASIREKLFAPHPDESSDYAMGWGLYHDPKYGDLVLHSGSNTMWTSRIIIAPDLDRVVIVNANLFNDDAQAAIRSVSLEILDLALLEQTPQ